VRRCQLCGVDDTGTQEQLSTRISQLLPEQWEPKAARAPSTKATDADAAATHMLGSYVTAWHARRMQNDRCEHRPSSRVSNQGAVNRSGVGYTIVPSHCKLRTQVSRTTGSNPEGRSGKGPGKGRKSRPLYPVISLKSRILPLMDR